MLSPIKMNGERGIIEYMNAFCLFYYIYYTHYYQTAAIYNRYVDLC